LRSIGAGYFAAGLLVGAWALRPAAPKHAEVDAQSASADAVVSSKDREEGSLDVGTKSPLLTYLAEEAVMTDDTIRHWDFLTGASTVAVAVIGSVVTAGGQTTRPFAAANPVPRAADLVLRNGNIITVDVGFRIARAIAIAGDRIIAVGSDVAMTPHTGPGTHVLDLKGKTVIPGLIDGHAHMIERG
jgi:hypothetical protein